MCCLGISVPKEDRDFIVSFIEQLEVVSNFFVPLFFANTGLRTDLTQLSSSAGPIFLVWALASVGKIAPAFFPDKRRHGDTQKGPELPKGVKDSERAHPKQRSEGQGVLKKGTSGKAEAHISENTCDGHIGLLLSPPSSKKLCFLGSQEKEGQEGGWKTK